MNAKEKIEHARAGWYLHCHVDNVFALLSAVEELASRCVILERAGDKLASACTEYFMEEDNEE